jgi:hypothetical protein
MDWGTGRNDLQDGCVEASYPTAHPSVLLQSPDDPGACLLSPEEGYAVTPMHKHQE